MPIGRSVIFRKGKRYEFIPLDVPINISKHNKTDYPTEITHLITGMEIDLYLLVEKTSEKELGFSFAYQMDETGLFMSIDDDKSLELLNSLVFEALSYE